MTENFEKKTTKTLADHSKNFDDHDKTLADHGKKLDKHQVILEKLVTKALEHDDEFVKVRDEIKETREQILSAIDSAMKKMSNVDEEQVMTRATLDRHEEDIVDIKKKLKVA